MTFQQVERSRTPQEVTDRKMARDLLEKALDKSSKEFRTHGGDRLIAAAHVYAILGGS